MNENNEPVIAAERAELEARVAAHPFFLSISEHHIRLLADCAMLTHFNAREVIFRAGEPANRFYLIKSGTVVLQGEVLDEAPVTIDIVSAGDLLGWSWLFPPYLWHFDARAAEPTSAIFFYGTILRQYCEKDPVLGYELLKRMSQVMVRRLQAARANWIEALKEKHR